MLHLRAWDLGSSASKSSPLGVPVPQRKDAPAVSRSASQSGRARETGQTLRETKSAGSVALDKGLNDHSGARSRQQV